MESSALIAGGIVIAIFVMVGLLTNAHNKKVDKVREEEAAAAVAQAASPMLVDCPACARQLSRYAAACPFCGHPLRQQTETVDKKQWSPGIAAVLSLVIPGAGQMYKGHVGAGLLWLIFVVGGYFFFIIPGLVLHLICIFSAATGE